MRQAYIRSSRGAHLRRAPLRKAQRLQRLNPGVPFQHTEIRGGLFRELLVILSLFMLSAPFTYQLGEVTYGPPDIYDAKYIFYIRFAFVLVSGGILAFSYFFLRIPFRLNPFPALLLIPFAMSMAWSWDVYMTFRALFEFGACIGFAYVLALYLTRRQVATVILHTFGLVAILSVIWVVAFPDVAIHSEVGDLSQDGHGGLWRGVYTHKNILGGIAGLALPHYLGPSRVLVRPRFLWAIYLAATVLCLVKSGAGTGFTMAFVGLVLVYVLALDDLFRAIGAAFLVVLAVFFALFGDALLALALELIGKDQTLTGRTYIWETALDLIAESPILGSGYPSLTNPSVLDRFLSTSGAASAHNSYLQILIESGVVGLTLWGLSAALALFRIAPELVRQRIPPEVGALVTIMIGLFLLGFSESTLVDCKQSLLGPVWIVVLIVLGSVPRVRQS